MTLDESTYFIGILTTFMLQPISDTIHVEAIKHNVCCHGLKVVLRPRMKGGTLGIKGKRAEWK